MAPREGDLLQGFVVREVRPLPELRATGYRLEHEPSGARWVHVLADDPEGLFSVTVPTVPGTDNGVPHILEHSVLGGSRKYPVRQPFFEMLKMSMGTYINAFTATDYTCYPVASPVQADLFNLADVYFDAVFHPLIPEETFAREGHRMAAADPKEPAGRLTETGIVYNEMKGYYSQPETRLHLASAGALLPDTAWRWSAGGRPDAILDLTYDGLVQFHREHYQPWLSYFFTYGDVSVQQWAEFLGDRLSGFARPTAVRDDRASPQPRFHAPRSVESAYAVGAEEPLAEKTFLLLEWIAGSGTDPADMAALEVLSWVLVGNEAAPLRKALVDARLGQAVAFAGLSAHGPDATFSVGLKGSEADRAERFLDVAVGTLRTLAEAGVSADRIEAAFRQAAYGHLEIRGQHPLFVRRRVVDAWRLTGDPFGAVAMRAHLDACRQRWRSEPELFARLIRERLLDNPHRVVTVLRPSREVQPQEEAAFTARMTQVRAGLSDAEAAALAARSAEVERRAGEANPPEAVALLPQLRVADIPRRPRHIPTVAERPGPGVELLRNDVFSNGINYLTLDFDVAGVLSDEEWAVVPQWVDAVHKMGAAGRGYEETAAREAAWTGGVDCWPAVGRGVGAAHRRLRFSVRALDEQVEGALGVLSDLVLAIDPRDRARLEVVIREAVAQRRTALVNGGVGTARRHAARRVSAEDAIEEQMHGASQLRRLFGVQAGFQEQAEGLMERIERLRDALWAGGRLVASFTGSDAAYAHVRALLAGWSGRLQATGPGAGGVQGPDTGAPRREGLAAPLQVAYVAQVLPAPGYLHPDSPLLSVGAHLLTTEYVRPEIRFKGAAYGGACTYDPVGGQLALMSWQDPLVARTLGVFAAAGAHAAGAAWSQVDVDRAIISVLKDGERPIRPGEATGLALQRHVAGLTPERREARHAAVLEASPLEVKRALAEALAAGAAGGGVTCVFGGRAKLEEANRELGAGQALEIEELLP